MVCLSVSLCLFSDKFLLYSPGWPLICHSPASDSWLLGLQACITIPSLKSWGCFTLCYSGPCYLHTPKCPWTLKITPGTRSIADWFKMFLWANVNQCAIKKENKKAGLKTFYYPFPAGEEKNKSVLRLLLSHLLAWGHVPEEPAPHRPAGRDRAMMSAGQESPPMPTVTLLWGGGFV